MKKHTITALLSLFFIQSYIYTETDTTLQTNINNLIKAKKNLQLIKTKKNQDKQKEKIKQIANGICNKMNYQIENIIDTLKANEQTIDPLIQKNKRLEKLYTNLFNEQKKALKEKDIYTDLLSKIQTPSIALLTAMYHAINDNTYELILELETLYIENNDENIKNNILNYINDAAIEIWNKDILEVYQLYNQASNAKIKETISKILKAKDKDCLQLLNTIKNKQNPHMIIKKLETEHQEVILTKLIENNDEFNNFTKNLPYSISIKLLDIQPSEKRTTIIQSHINKSRNQEFEQIPYKIRIGFGVVTSTLLSTLLAIKECYNKRSIKAALQPKKIVKHASFALCAGACGYFLPLLLNKERPLVTLKKDNGKYYEKINKMEAAKKLGTHLGLPIISACAPHLVNTIYSKLKTKKLQPTIK